MPFCRYSLHLILFILTLPVRGQELLFHNLDNINLPSQESYNVMQDSKGYIWVGTEAGLCRYNGHSLEIFNEKNGLPEQSCYAVKEDKRGILWIATSTGRILNFSNDSLYEAAISHNFQKYVRHNTNVHVYMFQFVGDSVYMHAPYASFRASPLSGQVESLPSPPDHGDYYFFSRGHILLPWKSYWRPVMYPLQHNIDIYIEADDKKKHIILPYRKNHSSVWRVMAAANQYGTKAIAFDDVLIRFSRDLGYKIYHLPNMILSLYCDPDGGFWVGTFKKGVFYYPDLEHSDQYLNSLRGFSVTGTCQDREKGIWCTTLEEGVFYSRSKKVVHYTNIDGLNKKAELLKAVNGNIYAASTIGKLLCLKGSKVNDYAVQRNSIYPPEELLSYNGGWLVSARDMLMQTDRQFRTIRTLTIQGRGIRAGGRQLLQTPGGRIFIVYDALLELLNSTVTERCDLTYKVTYIGQSNHNDELLAGTKRGLYRVDTKKFIWKKIGGVNDYVQKILPGTSGDIWVITRHSGLLLLRGDNLVPVKWLKWLSTDRLFDIKEDRYHVLWIGCNRGLVRVEGVQDNPRVCLYNVTNGLAANEVYDIAADSNYLYISTVKGISYFPLRASLSNTAPPGVFIRGVLTGNRQIKHMAGEPVFLSWKDNPIRVKVDGLCYKQGETTRLQYLLKGQDNVLHNQEGDEIVLGRLQPGSYELQVYALNSDGMRSAEPAIVQFRIQPPFWLAWWFIACTVTVIAVVLYLLVSRKIRQVRKKAQEMTRINHLIAEYRLTALQAQMNPHFIFNAINSIQTYILNNQSQVAYDYLAKFSRLIRQVLYHAKDRTLPLEQELNMIRTYTELEQLRFNSKFDVVLDIDPALDIYHTELPPMLLQPYVENAIWHGLLPLKEARRGILNIRLTRKEEELVIVIEDNGVGRQYKEKEKLQGHSSLGMTLNEQRMELLRHMPEYRGAAITITDLYDAQGMPSGTMVEVRLLLMEEITA